MFVDINSSRLWDLGLIEPFAATIFLIVLNNVFTSAKAKIHPEPIAEYYV